SNDIEVDEDKLNVFLIDNAEAVDEVVNAFGIANNTTILNWLRVTFFIKSRINPEWEASDTNGLKGSDIALILEFIATEANGGSVPEVSEDESLVAEVKN
ncbi:MAG: hypothetical protein ACRDBG_11130, partial [Waterburya sp.]